MGGALTTLELDHVGIVAADDSIPLIAALDSERPVGRQMPSGVIVARFGPAGRLELVRPGAGQTPVDGFLRKRGPGLHHVALRVSGTLGQAIQQARGAGIEPVGAPEPSSDGRPSVFLHPRTTGGVLVELLEGAAP